MEKFSISTESSFIVRKYINEFDQPELSPTIVADILINENGIIAHDSEQNIIFQLSKNDALRLAKTIFHNCNTTV